MFSLQLCNSLPYFDDFISANISSIFLIRLSKQPTNSIKQCLVLCQPLARDSANKLDFSNVDSFFYFISHSFFFSTLSFVLNRRCVTFTIVIPMNLIIGLQNKTKFCCNKNKKKSNCLNERIKVKLPLLHSNCQNDKLTFCRANRLCVDRITPLVARRINFVSL